MIIILIINSQMNRFPFFLKLYFLVEWFLNVMLGSLKRQQSNFTFCASNDLEIRCKVWYKIYKSKTKKLSSSLQYDSLASLW